MLHLQTSNQPPETIHFGILAAAAAAISSLINAKGSI
jgi:hypothetical protein